MKTTSELNMTKSPKDAHTTFNVKRKNYINYQGKRRAESDRITHRCPHFAALAALKTREIQRQPRHIESFCSGRPSFEQNYFWSLETLKNQKLKLLLISTIEARKWRRRQSMHIYICKRKLLGLASFHRCRWEGFQKSNAMTSLHSGYPKTRSKNAQVVSRYQRDPQMTKKKKQRKTVQNRGEAK